MDQVVEGPTDPVPRCARDAVEALLEAFPAEYCDLSPASPTRISGHLRSAAFASAASLARTAASALAAAAAAQNEDAVESALVALHAGLRRRQAPSGQLRRLTVLPSHVELLRLLFMSTVFLLDASSTPLSESKSGVSRIVRSQRAEAALQGLAGISIGAVGLPQLTVLEGRLLADLAEEPHALPAVLMRLLAQQPPLLASVASPVAAWEPLSPADASRRALVLRWVVTSLSTASLAPRLWEALPLLLRADPLERYHGGAIANDEEACVIARAALSGLLVEDATQLKIAIETWQALRWRCEAALLALNRTTHCSGPRALAHAAAKAAMMCARCFGMLHEVREPLLPTLLDGARDILHSLMDRSTVQQLPAGDTSDGRSSPDALQLYCTQLRTAVSAGTPGARKDALVSWLVALRSREMMEAV